MRFEIPFLGHENVLATHKSTIEITRESHLTPRGDCIVGVGAAHACADIPDAMRRWLKSSRSTVTIGIAVGGLSFAVVGRGDEGLTLTHADDIVIRRSAFACPRTLAVRCDKASSDMPRDIVRLLQNPGARGVLSITVS